VGLRVQVYAAEKVEDAYYQPMESAMASVTNLGNRSHGSASRDGTSGDWSAQSENILRMTYDYWLRDKVLCGTPEAIVEKLGQLTEDLGLDQIIYEINFGRRIPHERQMNNLRLMNEKVIPQLV